MKLQELFALNEAKQPFKGFSSAEVKQIDDEVLTKFTAIFKDDNFSDKSISDDEMLERLQGSFWSQIVEPGWAPVLIDKARRAHDEDDFEKIEEYQYEAQDKALKKLGLPPEVTEL